MSDDKKTGLALLREPFPKNAISKLPKPTKKQTDELKAQMNAGNFSNGIKCKECGQWHHKEVVHLDYVGHAALTDRLLDCDPNWNWEPLALNQDGTPAIDQNGGMWIKLTVCDVTRLGYGDADGKSGGNAVKERIGDALRNAAMRFGAALDLWHKGELHVDDTEEVTEKPKPAEKPRLINADQYQTISAKVELAGVDADKVAAAYGAARLGELKADDFDRAVKRLDLTISEKKPASNIPDELPYEGAAH